MSAQPVYFNENIFQRKGSHTVTQNEYAKLIAYFKIFAGTIPFSVMERAYFGGKQAVHLPAASGICANGPEYPWEEKRTHLSQISISNSAQITLLEAALNHQSCFTASLTAALLRRELGQGRTSITEHLLSRQKSFDKSPLISPPSLSHSKETGRWVLRLGKGKEMGRCWNLRQFGSR